MEFFSSVGNIASILGAIFALMAWIKARRIEKDIKDEKIRQSRKITVALHHGGNKIDLPVELTRSELTRGEILGRIGMIPMKEAGKRFQLEYVNKPEFLKQISNIINDSGEDILTIPCTEEEIKQFKIK